MSEEAVAMDKTQHLMARAWLFRGLSRCFADPSTRAGDPSVLPEVIERIGECVQLQDDAQLRAAWEQLRGAAESVPPARGTPNAPDVGTATDAPTIAQEYAYLFMGRVKVPLNEASYGIDLTFARSREMADIASYYAAFGFELGAEAMEMADHLAIQLEFLALFCLKEAYALERGWAEEAEICREARARYLTEHLTGWMPVLQNRMQSRARLAFYPAATAVTARAVTLEHARAGAETPTLVLREPIPHKDDDLPPSCGGCPAFMPASADEIEPSSMSTGTAMQGD